MIEESPWGNCEICGHFLQEHEYGECGDCRKNIEECEYEQQQSAECICWPTDFSGFSVCGIPCRVHPPKKAKKDKNTDE